MKKPFFKFPAAVLSICIFMSSCGKDGLFGEKTNATGVVLDERTRKPIPNATVSLIEQLNQTDGPNPTQLSIQNTDTEGRFSFSFNADYSNYSYFVEPKKDKYMQTGNIGSDIPKGGASGIELFLVPYASYKLHFINSKGGIGFRLKRDGTLYTLKPGADTLFNANPASGYNTISISYWVLGKDSVERGFMDYIYLTPFVTTIHEINY